MASQFIQGLLAPSEIEGRQADIQHKRSVVEMEQAKRTDSAIDSVITSAAKFSDAYQKGMLGNITKEQYQQGISQFLNTGLRTSQLAVQSGRNIQNTPELVQTRLSSLMNVPDPSETAVSLGTVESTKRGARADAAAKRGIPVAAAEEAAGLRPKGPSNIFNINTSEGIAASGQKKATEKLGIGIGDRANTRLTQSFDAQRQNAQLDRIKLALSRGAGTSIGEETLLDAKSLAQTAFGIQLSEDVSEQETIRVISNEMALRLRNPESGLGLTGNTSNRDLSFLKSSIPGLQRTHLGNLKIIDLTKRMNRMRIDVANEQQRILMENGGVVPLDLDTKLMKFTDKYPFLTKEERTEIEKLTRDEKIQTQPVVLSPAGASAFEKWRPK